MIRSILFFSLLACTVAAQAQVARVPKELESFKAFTRGAHLWKFDLKYGYLGAEEQRQEEETRLLASMERIAFIGVRKLYEVNPQLAVTMLGRILHEPLTITDKPDDEEDVYGAASTNEKERLIFLGNFAFSSLVHMTRTTGVSSKEVASASGAIFHELMHLARLDNLPAYLHNSPGFQNHEMENDVIYACEAQVFPNSFIYSQDEGTPRDLTVQGYTNTKLACEVCSSARVVGESGTMIDFSSLTTSQQKHCQNIPEVLEKL